MSANIQDDYFFYQYVQNGAKIQRVDGDTLKDSARATIGTFHVPIFISPLNSAFFHFPSVAKHFYNIE